MSLNLTGIEPIHVVRYISIAINLKEFYQPDIISKNYYTQILPKIVLFNF